MARYINNKGEEYNGRYVIIEGVKYLSPSATKLAELGYHVVVEQPQVYEPTTEERIWTLKEQLAATDYKVVKIAEYLAAGLPAPYDIEQLHAERQALRDKINEIEEEEE